MPSRPRKIRRGGFTLVEIMLVVAIIATLAALAMPSWMRARKRSQAALILKQLKTLDDAQELYAMEYSKAANQSVNWTDLPQYLKPGTSLYLTCQADDAQDLLGNDIPLVPLIGGGSVSHERDGVPTATFTALSDVAPEPFWSPFPIGTPP